jgi:hypothetical protein
VERRTSARAAALARRRAKGGSDSGTPEQLRWSESEVAQLNLSLVFNPEDWSRDTEPATWALGQRTEESTKERAEDVWIRWKKKYLPPECQTYTVKSGNVVTVG